MHPNYQYNHCSGIYQIRNILTQDLYVGSAKDIYTRGCLHLSELNKNRHHSPILQHAWNKYGKDSFVHEIIKLCEKENLIVEEQKQLDSLKPKYNILTNARSCLGIKRPYQCKPIYQIDSSTLQIIKRWDKVTEALKETGIKTILLVLTGKQTIAGGYRWCYVKDYKPLEEYSSQTKALKIQQIDSITGTVIKTWDSINQVSKQLKIKPSDISHVCKGGLHTAGGYKWKYVDSLQQKTTLRKGRNK
jgi:group I intron endonuclease